MNQIGKDTVSYITILEDHSKQRIDNFLIKTLKGVPKSHIYSIIRSGQVRVNKKRVNADYKLTEQDIVRIPPVRMSPKTIISTGDNAINFKIKMPPVIYEDDFVVVINKPSGVASHGGSGISYGAIEQVRQFYKQKQHSGLLELVHRLDKDTSGLLMIAKKRSFLVQIHEQIRNKELKKEYLALSLGKWPENVTVVNLPLLKFNNSNNEKIVQVSNRGIAAQTEFSIINDYDDFSLLQIKLKTGRTHQIRVHMQSQGCPVAGDEKYGDFKHNKLLKKKGLKRMFLHAHSLKFYHPNLEKKIQLIAPLPDELKYFINTLKKNE